MFKKVFNRIRVNFRETKSERSATGSYRGYQNKIRSFINKANIVNRLRKDRIK